MKRLAWVAVALAGAAVAWGQAERSVRIEYSNPGLIPATWVLELHPDGSGHFHSERGSATQSSMGWMEPPDLNTDVRLSAAFASHVFDTAAAEHYFQMDCESHAKVAFQGKKQLSYAGPDGSGTCSFNYAKEKTVQELADSLEAVATTIIEGARLERLRQHDRLGLDQEMQNLTEMTADGRATEVGVIREELERIAEDEALMDRVRRKARELLAKAAQ
ncbi:hypothetical protein [Terracidiphilus gabretensis]|jgi:hypothetical protein|uniref:hypothetical protein n=1 Tax=Terracidiphilus gabretensis TaxID=1577687 RepID=UPI00071BA8E1|nr:hypothetical protein [Terracidiphilus gabretensis]